MKQATFNADRVNALSDGVFAIALTLLVLDLRLPDAGAGLDRGAFSAALLEQGPRLASWILSFAILCRLWITQHALSAAGETRSRGFVAWNFLFLGAVSFIPFSTSLLAEHHDEALSVIVFSAGLAVAGIALVGMWQAWLGQRPAGGASDVADRSAARPTAMLLATAVVASGVALLSPNLGVLAWAAFPLLAVGTARRGAGRSLDDANPDE